MQKIYLLACAVILVACTSKTETKTEEDDLDAVVKLMAGEFSSEEQAAADSNYFNINLVMFPIWESSKDVRYLYVEQAVSYMLDTPYRQRIYRVSKTDDGRIESGVFEIPNPMRFVHGWNTPEIFDQLTPDSLITREGCSVFLTKDSTGCFAGSTPEKSCKSDFRGASYATSEVSICGDEVVSWDRGWNDADEHVWGAENGGYIFKRKK